MTVEWLIDELNAMSPTAEVQVQIRRNVSIEGGTEELYEFREATIETVVYSRGRVVIQLDE